MIDCMSNNYDTSLIPFKFERFIWPSYVLLKRLLPHIDMPSFANAEGYVGFSNESKTKLRVSQI